MLSKDDIVVQVDHIHDVLRIVLLEELENLEFDSRLVIVLLLVLNDLEGDIYARLVIPAFDCRSERALS